MSELTNDLSTALLEERDNSNLVLASMHKTHMRLLDILGKIEARLDALESRGESNKDEFASWMTDNIGEIAASLTKIDDFNSYIESLAEEAFEERFSSAISKVSITVDRIDAQLEY